MKNKHTPSPWVVSLTSSFVFPQKEESEPICQFFSKHEEDFPNKIANAKLIAAAPELLKMLKEMVDEFQGAAEGAEVGTSSLPVWKKAKKVIKNATE